MMLKFKSVLRHFRKGKAPARMQSLEQTSKFSTLPTEIIEHISGFLPMCSVAALSLCSRRLFWLFGGPAFRSMGRAEKFRFLVLLEKDYPGWLLCHHCHLFHPIAEDDGPWNTWWSSREPACVRANGVVWITLGYRLRFHHAQLLMNHSRFGHAPHKGGSEKLFRTFVGRTYGGSSLVTDIWCLNTFGQLPVRVDTSIRLATRSDIGRITYWIPDICIHLKGPYQRDFAIKRFFVIHATLEGQVVSTVAG